MRNSDMVPSRRAIVFTLLPMICFFASCNQPDGEDDEKIVATERPKTLPSWLTVKDRIEPAVWLRGREVGHMVLISDPEVDRLRRALHQTTIRFFEDPRMVANRTAQTGQMLAEFGQPERYVDILTGMVDVADIDEHKKLYGEMCQHYLNVRKAGSDRAAAIEILMKSYKADRTRG